MHQLRIFQDDDMLKVFTPEHFLLHLMFRCLNSFPDSLIEIESFDTKLRLDSLVLIH